MASNRKFLCDEMLAALARWLRAAGYDTEMLEKGCGDDEVLERAHNEGLLILTRDGELAQRRKAKGAVYLMKAADLDGQARELASAFGVDWLHNPFSRCMVDNTPLRPAKKAEIESLPEDTREAPGGPQGGAPPHLSAGDAPAAPGPFNACPECGRLYWPGSHVRRMMRKLEKWKSPE